MRVLDGDQCLVRMFRGESDQFHHAPLHRVLLDRLRREGFAGATAIHGRVMKYSAGANRERS